MPKIPYRRSLLWLAALTILWLAASDPRSAPAQDAKPNSSYYLQPQDVVLFLGDSITAETKYYWLIFHDDLAQKYPQLGTADVAYKKEELVAPGIKFVNGGLSGDVAGGGLGRLDALIAAHRPTVCVVCFGMNDHSRDRANYQANLRAIVKKCREQKIAVTVLTAPCVDTVSKPELKESVKLLFELAAEAKQVAEQEGALLADCYTPFRKSIEEQKRALSYGDGIHPNDAGHRLMADTLEKVWGFGLPLAPAAGPRPTQAARAAPPRSGGALNAFHGGVIWEPMQIAPEVNTCELIWVHPKTGTAYAFCNKQDVYASTDEGRAWKLLTTDARRRPTGMVEQVLLDPQDEESFYATAMYGGGAPYRTTDAGRTWQPLGLGACDFMAVDFSDPHRRLMLACLHEAANGFRLNRDVTAAPPAAWQAIDLKNVSSGAWLHVVDSNTWLLAGMAWGHGKAGVYRTADAGKTFQLLGDATALAPTHRAGFQEHGGRLLYLSGKGVVASSDQGRNWQLLPTPEQPWSLAFAGEGAWLAGDRGMYYSADELRTWQPVASSRSVRDAFFAVHPSGKTLFVNRYDGTRQRGVWQPQPAELVVWSGDLPGGQTWSKFGPGGSIGVATQAGRGESGRGLLVHIDGDGWRGGGLNWKGWYPTDACDDVSHYSALVFYIRQVTKVDDADLAVTLGDNLQRKAGTAASNPVHIVADGALDRIDGTWRRVVLPLERFAHDKPLDLHKLWQIDFSAYGSQELTFQIDQIGFAVEQVDPPRFKAGPAWLATALVKPEEVVREIPEAIYGVCGLGREQLIEYRIPITRWGGNPSSRYNWKLGVDNGASDWFFRNRGELLTRLSDSGYLKHIETNQVFGASAYQTVPTIGWVAKDATAYGFSVAKYGPQKSTEPGSPDVGNGLRKDGTPVAGNDPADTSVPAPPAFVGQAVKYVSARAGTAEAGGVAYWALDNEPMLWHATHRDVHPRPCGYNELWERTVQYAEAIKKMDPSAQVAGFCNWGWTDLYYSAADAGDDNYQTKADWQAHGKMPLAEWFIKQCGDYQREHGHALVDVFDTHWYPQGQVKGQGAYLGRGINLELNAYRMLSTRDLWDPKYPQDSWIRNTDNYSPVALLPRVRTWIAKHNPGMKVCLGEYNFGGGDNVTGCLAQAEVFGVLARAGADLAFLWHTPAGSQQLAWQLFRSYDGHGSGFGNELLFAESSHRDLSVHAARRTADGAITIAVINQNLQGPCALELGLGALSGNLRVWRVDQDTVDRVAEVPEAAAAVRSTVRTVVPAASVSMLVVTPDRAPGPPLKK